MAGDLTGGLDPNFEHFQASPPSDPQMRDSATLWVIDQSGALALPRVTIDVLGGEWAMPRLQLNFVQADGRTLRIWSQGAGEISCDHQGSATTRSAGPLRFECVEPFRRWTITFDGRATASSTAAQLAGERGETSAPLAFHIEADMAAPPWLMGGMTAEAAASIRAGEASVLMGGMRYEQLCRVKGWVDFAGGRSGVEGTGMRVRRQGVRNMAAAPGHCQLSALFPSGKGFGAIVFAPGPEGPEAFNEAFVLGPDGRMVAARIVRAPWMTRLVERGDDAALVLAGEAGEVRIEGETLLTMFDHHDFEMAAASVLQQGTARYVWNGEETIGLIERCTARSRLPAGQRT